MNEDIYSVKVDEIGRRAALRPVGETYIIPRLFGDEWADFIKGCNPKVLGRRYSEAIEGGLIRHSRFLEVNRSPRYSRYVRLDVEADEG